MSSARAQGIKCYVMLCRSAPDGGYLGGWGAAVGGGLLIGATGLSTVMASQCAAPSPDIWGHGAACSRGGVLASVALIGSIAGVLLLTSLPPEDARELCPSKSRDRDDKIEAGVCQS